MTFIELTDKEEQVLYDNYKNLECPKRMHVNCRRVWWVPKEEIGGSFFSFSICQHCYRDVNKMKKIVDETKFTFIPILTTNILFVNCDASDVDSSFNLNLDDSWLAGIYLLDNDNIKLLESSINDNVITVKIPNDNCLIGICVYKKSSEPHEYKISIVHNDIQKLKSMKIHSFDDEFLLSVSQLTNAINFGEFKTMIETKDNIFLSDIMKLHDPLTYPITASNGTTIDFRCEIFDTLNGNNNLLAYLDITSHQLNNDKFRYKIEFMTANGNSSDTINDTDNVWNDYDYSNDVIDL